MKFLALLILIPSLAMATGKPEPLPVATSESTATSVSGAEANAEASAAADAASESSSDANATNEGNHLSTSIVSKQKRQAPSGFAAASNTTAGCYKARGVFLSAPGAGLGLNGGKIDRDCTLMLAADEELRRGNLQASIQLRCATKLYRDVFTPKDCAALLNTQTAPAKPKPEACVTQAQLDRSFKACSSK